MASNKWTVGDWIIYRKSKISSSPGPRAINVAPADKGESYNYSVDKFWVVVSLQGDGAIVARTVRGKLHTLHSNDPALRKPSFWERWIFGSRFRKIEEGG